MEQNNNLRNMEEESINTRLMLLYIDKLSLGNPCFLQILREQRRSIDESIRPAYPLMIEIDDELRYKNADLRIMVFGQEPNTWETKVSQIEIPINESYKYVSETVKKFKEAYKEHKNRTDLKTPFWSAFKTIKELTRDMNCEVVWNDIYKIGNKQKNTNRPHEQIRKLENEYFDVIHHEISILKPDVLLFFTGPSYEARVNKKFGIKSSQPISKYNDKALAKISIMNEILAYRTYHPGYLRRKGFFREYIKLIIEDIKKEKYSLS